MIVYPESGYNTFISVNDADSYFSERLNASAWDSANQEAALVTAYRSLQELDIVVDLSDSDALQALKTAQCEQALYLMVNIDTLEGQAVSGLTLAGVLSVKLPQDQTEPARYSPRALALLRPYLRGRSIAWTR
jgi:hypothetical protein